MMRVVVIGNGMVGQRFLEQLAARGEFEVTAFCEEPRPAYDRVQLTSFFSGKTASDLSLFNKELLEKAGFKVGTVQEFLGLSDEEAALIELKIRLIGMLRTVRLSRNVTQHALARLIGSSQSRVAKMEAGAADVSLDLICTALFALGVSRQEIGRIIVSKRAA